MVAADDVVPGDRSRSRGNAEVVGVVSGRTTNTTVHGVFAGPAVPARLGGARRTGVQRAAEGGAVRATESVPADTVPVVEAAAPRCAARNGVARGTLTDETRMVACAALVTPERPNR